MLDNLQQVFIELTIRTEQKQCASEGIAWSCIPFFRNGIVCMLSESSGRGGFSKNKFSTQTKAYQYVNNKFGFFANLEGTVKTVTALKASRAAQQFLLTLLDLHGDHPHFKKCANVLQTTH